MTTSPLSAIEPMGSRQIYIVITQTGSVLSRILRHVTGAEYNHASISLSPDLLPMYSFGRRHPSNPFFAGFVEESPVAGTFKRFSNTKALVIALPVSEDSYEGIARALQTMLAHRTTYHYDFIGLLLAGLHIHHRRWRHYYCSDFVRELLLRHQVEGSDKLDLIVQPMHFLNMPGCHVIYCGYLREYPRAVRGRMVS